MLAIIVSRNVGKFNFPKYGQSYVSTCWRQMLAMILLESGDEYKQSDFSEMLAIISIRNAGDKC